MKQRKQLILNFVFMFLLVTFALENYNNNNNNNGWLSWTYLSLFLLFWREECECDCAACCYSLLYSVCLDLDHSNSSLVDHVQPNAALHTPKKKEQTSLYRR
jgi:hypothetical protein